MSMGEGDRNQWLKSKISGRRTLNKSAVTGRFVSKKTVKTNPKTTYRQTIKKKGK